MPVRYFGARRELRHRQEAGGLAAEKPAVFARRRHQAELPGAVVGHAGRSQGLRQKERGRSPRLGRLQTLGRRPVRPVHRGRGAAEEHVAGPHQRPRPERHDELQRHHRNVQGGDLGGHRLHLSGYRKTTGQRRSDEPFL